MDNIKKNAFTLIELLAVILILGIIALIAIPVVNELLKESKAGAFNTTVTTLANKAEEICQLETIKGENKTNLYTIVKNKVDHPLEIKGSLPREGYILVNNNCEVAYTFYDDNNVVSKTFNEKKSNFYNKDNIHAYGLEWKSNITNMDDTYTRTLDANNIEYEDVNVQNSLNPVMNAFDKLDIYKDILPFTDSFGNQFMLIPKFYISKTKEVTSDEIIWNYAVSKQKLDDTYYLPSNFVDEGIDNDKHIELPYVLVGKYEAGYEIIEGEERLVSKSGLIPKTKISINTARSLATSYNDIEGINGYQQYDIHVHDLLTILIAIEFKTMNSQSIISGYTNNTTEDSALITGGSDKVTSSSGATSPSNSSFIYRGIENLWGNIWSFVDGVNIDQINDDKSTIYTAHNARYYSSDSITKYYKKLNSYKKLNTNGIVKESGFDSNAPFINLPVEIRGNKNNGTGDYYYQRLDEQIKIVNAGGEWAGVDFAGMSNLDLSWNSNITYLPNGTRILKTPIN